MGEVLTTKKAIGIANQLREQHKRVVLAGGCFDILHIGHIEFLQKAKAQGDVLFVMLESDARIKQTKGEHRPLNPQADRAAILTALHMVDYVITLPADMPDQAYDELVIGLKPAIIATTAGDPGRMHKERQAKLVGAQVVDVIPAIANQSTSRIVEFLQEL
jgi:rfaE bifunctional protein nucleotidyltransferase chain/domain